MPAGIALLVLLVSFAGSAFGQAADTSPKFEAVDIRPATNGFFEGVQGHAEGERYVVRGATMVNLIRPPMG